MPRETTFSEFLRNLSTQFDNKGFQRGIVSICLKIPSLDLIELYKYFFEKYEFSSFWEENEFSSYIALDKCQSSQFNGEDKFDQAKDFTKNVFKEIVPFYYQKDNLPLSKVIYFSSFSDNDLKNSINEDVPGIEAVLPRILIIKQSNNCWLKIHHELDNPLFFKDLLKEIWSYRNQMINRKNFFKKENSHNIEEIKKFNLFLNNYNKDLKKDILEGLDLVNQGILEKIVLCKRINYETNHQLDIFQILMNFRLKISNSCIYVWKRNHRDITFGTSPEKLFSFKDKLLSLEAIAGTAKSNSSDKLLLKSPKDIREHDFVINYLLDSLRLLKIPNYKKGDLKVVSFGPISHLSTHIKSYCENYCPFDFLKILHPTPAVAGFPKDKSIIYIEKIESFSRDNYASPIGWVDSLGNADFRVSIRGARLINNKLELTAGAGIVEGSVLEKELEEINFKISVLVELIFS